jgi:FMN phosphatase YigB (HAD superfamily)
MLNNVKYLLFDLDGTLIKFDLNTFIQNYLRLIQDHFSNLPFAKSVPEWIMGGTSVMLNSIKTITNKDKFVRFFQGKSGLTEDKIWEIFLHFYNTDYNHLKEITQPIEDARLFLESAVSHNFTLVLATQPLFPEIAIKKRLSWAGLEHIPFQFITHIENMYASKPHKAYFDQILKMLNADGDCCMMIGNDAEMDMAARKSDIHTYYLETDSAVSKTQIENADYSGNFKKLSSILGMI